MVGLGFCSLQALLYSGIIYLDWKELEKAVQAKLDRNGDGKVCVCWTRFHGSMEFFKSTHVLTCNPDSDVLILSWMELI